MLMNKYKILWIDDQYELLSELMERCEVVNGFEITKCRFAKEGMNIFEKRLEEWSAVILDAKVLMESLNEIPNLNGLRFCRDRINELKPRRYVPMFVFTGQPDLISNELFENMVDKYYSKGDDDDQLIARYGHINITEIVLSCASDDNIFKHISIIIFQLKYKILGFYHLIPFLPQL